ncbi:prepilin-type N-terminal cleavage/methylation domain-containing protein [Methylophilaceae bacterium 11]|nr:prepilin-type N-terminal cleavage/methylation domain-containing protein [Methylophilaceae bacterium 11]
MTSLRYRSSGFTLVEIAIVLVIFGLIMSALFVPLRAQREQAALTQTINAMDNAKQALLAFAQVNGRLPCPATATNFIKDTDAGSFGMENPLGGTRNITPPLPAVPNCAAYVGFLPAATLGLQPVDGSGFALDAWGNRIRYAVTSVDSSATCGGDTAPDFTTAGNMSVVGLSCLAPNLRVCSTSVVANCSVAVNLINNAVAVVYSTGATAVLGSAGKADESENLNIDTIFVSHDIYQGDTPNEFDHIVTWISPYVLYNAMIQAGQLH